MTVAVLRSQKDTTEISLTVNGKTDASSTGDMCTQALLGHIPLLLHPYPKDVFVVGLGSGATVGAVLKHPVRSCNVAEISRDVVEASRFFDHITAAPLEDPRTRLLVCDAREQLIASPPSTYDVIISEPSNPWIAGIGNLFTVEFYEKSRRALRPHGLFVQWLHLYEMDERTLGVALNTLRSVFPYVTVWSPTVPDIILVASTTETECDTSTMRAKLRVSGVSDDLKKLWPRVDSVDIVSFLSLQVLSSDGFASFYPGTGRLNRDRFPYLEYQAPRAFFTKSYADLLKIDERIKSRTNNSLYVSRYLGNRQINLSEARRLCEIMATRDAQSDAIIKHGLSYAIYTESIREISKTYNAIDSLQQLPINDYLRWGNLGLIGNELLWKIRNETGRLTRQESRDHFAFLLRKQAATTSVFWGPDTADIAAAISSVRNLWAVDLNWAEKSKKSLYHALGITPESNAVK